MAKNIHFNNFKLIPKHRLLVQLILLPLLLEQFWRLSSSQVGVQGLPQFFPNPKDVSTGSKNVSDSAGILEPRTATYTGLVLAHRTRRRSSSSNETTTTLAGLLSSLDVAGGRSPLFNFTLAGGGGMPLRMADDMQKTFVDIGQRINNITAAAGAGFFPPPSTSQAATVRSATSTSTAAGSSRNRRSATKTDTMPHGKGKAPATGAAAVAAAADEQKPVRRRCRNRETRSAQSMSSTAAAAGPRSASVSGVMNAKSRSMNNGNYTGCIFTPDQFFNTDDESKDFAAAGNKNSKDGGGGGSAAVDTEKLASALASKLMRKVIIEQTSPPAAGTTSGCKVMGDRKTRSTDADRVALALAAGDGDQSGNSNSNAEWIEEWMAKPSRSSSSSNKIKPKPQESGEDSSEEGGSSCSRSNGSRTESSAEAPHLVSSPIIPPKERPGLCKLPNDSTNSKIECLHLSSDTIVCRKDGDCPGTKKCCFFTCQPFSHVGSCQIPVLF